MTVLRSWFTLSYKWQVVVVLLCALLPNLNTLFHGFVLDDKVVYTENQYVQKGISGIPQIFSSNSFEGYFTGSGKGSTVSENRYRPLTLAFFAVEKQIFGNQAFLAHLIHLLFYGLLCFLLFNIIQKLLAYKYPADANALAMISACLFAVHPLHSEVVANIKSLDEIFVLLFSLLSVNSVLKYQKSKGILQLTLAGLWFLFALFSKEHAIVWLVLLPLALFYFTPIDKRSLLKSIIPMVAAATIYVVCRLAVLGTQLYVDSRNFLENPFLTVRGEKILLMQDADRIGTILYTLLRYIYLHIFPYPLTHDYAPKSISTYAIASPAAVISLMLYLLFIVLIIKWRKSLPVISYGLMFFIIALLPASNLFVNTGAYMGERFAFMPSLGLCLVFAWFLKYAVIDKFKMGMVVFLILILAFSARTFTRNLDWKDNLTLFTADIKHSSNSAKLNSSLGFTLLENYRNSADKESNKHLLTQAIGYLNKAVKVYPRYSDCIFLLGNAYYLNKNYPEAVVTYEKYIDLNPADASIIKNYQKALRELGRKYFYDDSNNSAAKNALLKSYKLNNQDDQVLELLGSVEAEMGYLLKSLEYLLKSVEINPNSASTWANLYITYTRLGDKARAQDAINRGMAIDADIVKKLMSVKTK
ncbi:MAG: glycosyltransferase family 39 protein [Saprospiraceae bacterium]|nr:glycosyltransferase family 39 protein [Saprospiraceae bacterium]